MKERKRRKYIIVILLMLVVLVSGTTHALFIKTVNTEKVITIKSGKRYIGIYGEDKENLRLNVTYTFTIENRGIEDASYQVTIEDIINTVGRENINYTYTNGETTKTGKLSDGIIEEENLAPGEKVTVTIRLTSDLSGDYKGKIVITTKEPINKNIYCTNGAETGPNSPELAGDMIPVVYNETTKNWDKADINGKWYDYEEQMWANAVTIKDQTKRAEYVSASAGTPILMEDMNTMMVWIPRYSYTLGNTYGYKIEGASEPSQATPGAFDIKFIDKNTIDTCSGKYQGNTPLNYYTPSSFCWGDTCDVESTRKDAGNIELSGIWISKFEITGTLNSISSLPNKKSIVNTNVSSYFNNIKDNMNNNNGLINYGLKGNYDTHMIKNTEWGAFVYLSQSKYGKYGNKAYTGINKEIYINNTTKTGCSSGSINAGSSSVCNYEYNMITTGRGASTTGTIYGIYDVSGNSFDFVMGNYNNISKSSGFSSMPARRYYNLYINDTSIKGDAINADGTAGFYNDSVYLLNITYPWYARSGTYVYKEAAGIFHFIYGTGGGNTNNSTRLSIVTW